MAKIRPTKEQLQESYERLQSVRKVGVEFGFSGETIRAFMHEYGLAMLRSNAQVHTCNHEFFATDTEGSFYLAGLMAADGCVKKHSGKNPKINQFYLCLGEGDEELMLKVKNMLNATHTFHKVTTKNSERNPLWNDSRKLELVITSERLCNDLKKFNVVPRKTHTYTFPEWLINHPMVNHFMRGYNDGDGSFYIQDKTKTVPQICFSLRGTPEFLRVYRSILERECDIPVREKDIRVNCGIGILEYGGNGVIGKIAKFLYRKATISLKRKQFIVSEVL